MNAATAAVSLAIAASMFAVGSGRDASPGYALWIAGAVSLSGALTLLAAQGYWPASATVVLANALVAFRYVLVTAGLERFVGREPRWVVHATGVGAAAVVSAFCTFVVPAVTVRIVFVTFGMAAWSLWSLAVVLREVPAVIGGPGRLAAAALGLEALWSLARVGVMLLGSDTLNALPRNAPVQAAFFVAFSAITAALAFGLNGLHTRRVEVELARSLAEVQVLRGIISICASCKRVRDGERWVQVEAYVRERSEAEFSHGLCPTCEETLYRAE